MQSSVFTTYRKILVITSLGVWWAYKQGGLISRGGGGGGAYKRYKKSFLNELIRNKLRLIVFNSALR